MDKKKYLQQAFRLNQQINAKISQLEELDALAKKCTGVINGMPHNPNKATSAMENVVCKIIDLKNEINATIDRLVDLKREIAKAIAAVEDSDCRAILEMRYLCNKTWKEIAAELHWSRSNVYMLHRKALELITLE